MRTPPLLIALTLLFWGVESGNLIVGIIMAVLVVGVALLPARWNMSDEDCVRVSDLTSIVFLTASALIFLNVDMVFFLSTIVIWQPVILLPLILAQLSSGRKEIIIGTRLSFNKKSSHKHNPIDFKIYYLAVCLLATAMVNSRSQLFFPCAGTILFWLLLVNRGKAFSLSTFVIVFLMAVGGGYFAMKGAEITHEYASKKTRSFMRGYFYSRHADPFQAHLSFGSLGKLKTSGKIILRLGTEDTEPTLLRQASYEIFHKKTWHSNLPFQSLLPQHLTWNLLAEPHIPDKQATIELYLPKEKGLLPHPRGSYLLKGPEIFEMEQKNDGITKVVDGAPLITYDIFYNSSLNRENDQPTPRNLKIHREEDKVLDKVVENWQLENVSNQAKVAMIHNFFAGDFAYSLTLRGQGSYSSALENFLLGSRVGYCELFATATTLLLRKIGIPSRYVTGFGITEKSRLENKFIVRQRHAHAWSEAYVDGRWIVVDTTPADWFNIDSLNRSRFEKVTDLFDLLKLRYNHFRIQTEQNYTPLLSLVVLVLAAILVYRIYRRMDKKSAGTEGLENSKAFKAVDSPLYKVEQRLEEIGGLRHKNEPFLFWAKRINGAQNIELATIEQMFHLHIKLRFDPTGLKDFEQKNLKELARHWLATH